MNIRGLLCFLPLGVLDQAPHAELPRLLHRFPDFRASRNLDELDKLDMSSQKSGFPCFHICFHMFSYCFRGPQIVTYWCHCWTFILSSRTAKMASFQWPHGFPHHFRSAKRWIQSAISQWHSRLVSMPTSYIHNMYTYICTVPRTFFHCTLLESWSDTCLHDASQKLL